MSRIWDLSIRIDPMAVIGDVAIGDRTITQATGPQRKVAKITGKIAEANTEVAATARAATITEVQIHSDTMAEHRTVGHHGRIQEALRGISETMIHSASTQKQMTLLTKSNISSLITETKLSFTDTDRGWAGIA